nr:MAG TPA: hypothetical protein [Caudoviricetes sp.]
MKNNLLCCKSLLLRPILDLFRGKMPILAVSI